MINKNEQKLKDLQDAYNIVIFRPKHLVVIDHHNRKRLVKVVDVRGIWPDGSIGIDQYYDSNHAAFKRVSLEELRKIDGYYNGKKLGKDYIPYFQESFK